ncbi:hypothetical protein [Salibacterium salarium]|uniref:hypothetical protein n=1 Tax=Salibacterium salarium TaxID=284579 RepID=UPI000F79A607|nr:hypothetical protein [Salibacterium salarium]
MSTVAQSSSIDNFLSQMDVSLHVPKPASFVSSSGNDSRAAKWKYDGTTEQQFLAPPCSKKWHPVWSTWPEWKWGST